MSRSDQKYLQSLIAQGENQELDFKFEINDERKIARTVSAFSNTDGGRLLIGVKDNGRISGIRSEEEYYMIEAAASLYSKPEVEFESRNRKVEGKSVLEIYIPSAIKKPVFALNEKNRWLAYMRVGDQNVLASVIQLEIWKERNRTGGKLLKFTRREEILLKYLEKEAGTSLSKIIRDTGFRRKELVSLLTKLVLFDVVDMKYCEGKNCFRLKERPGENNSLDQIH